MQLEGVGPAVGMYAISGEGVGPAVGMYAIRGGGPCSGIKGTEPGKCGGGIIISSSCGVELMGKVCDEGWASESRPTDRPLSPLLAMVTLVESLLEPLLGQLLVVVVRGYSVLASVVAPQSGVPAEEKDA